MSENTVVAETAIDTTLFTGTPEELAEATGETTEVTLESVLEELVTEETYSPYALHKIVNGVFEVFGSSKRIPPQMMYNYAAKGMLGNEKGTKVITAEQVKTWITKYVPKHI
jgi:hypothetical protein